MRKLSRLGRRTERGATIIEYVLIAALLVLVTLVGIRLTGANLTTSYSELEQSVNTAL